MTNKEWSSKRQLANQALWLLMVVSLIGGVILVLSGCTVVSGITICQLDPDHPESQNCAKGDKRFTVPYTDMKCDRDAAGDPVDCWFALPQESIKKVADKLEACENQDKQIAELKAKGQWPQSAQ